ncbi:MAG TPA: HIT family protein [Planctomycetota bacterium]|nr:HIT family protein [Planctomycetota bacterium]
MPTLFTRILKGELPGRFVWSDARAAAFLTIAPIRPGHTLVVPREEVDHWIDMPSDLAHHVFDVAANVSRGIQRAFPCAKVGLLIAGLEVPHAHLHLVPADRIADLDFALQDQSAKPEELDDAAVRLRAALRDLGYAQASDRP